MDNAGRLRQLALRQLGNNLDLANAGQTNVLAEYTLHNLSDADFTLLRAGSYRGKCRVG